MARDLAADLQDILEACVAIECVAIEEVMVDVSLDAYKSRPAVRSAVEREFILIGEALRRIGCLDDSLSGSISNARAIVEFRNLLAHDTSAIDDKAVDGVVDSDLIVLKEEVAQLLARDPQAR